MVLDWLNKPHVAEWFHGEGLKNTISGISDFLDGKETIGTYWLSIDENNIPFGFMITSIVEDEEAKEPDNHLRSWVEPGKNMITLDVLIGEEKFLGRGYASIMIEQFLKDKFKEVDIVFIDPESTNAKAIHVYEKVGFKQIDMFIASWHKVPHTLMQLRIL